MNPNEQTQALTETRAVPEATKAVTKFTAEHGKEVGLPSPEAINFMMSVANMLTHSALITPDMGNTVEQIKANAMAKMLVAHEMGIPALQGLQEIDIVKGKIFVRYPQLISQMMRKGLKLEWLERSDKTAVLVVTPPPGAMMMQETFEFTIEDARRAGLVRDGSQYVLRPRVMLCSRVVSEAFRMTGGLSSVYTPEERDEILNHREPSDPAPPAQTPFLVTAEAKPADPEKSNSGNSAGSTKAEETAEKIVSLPDGTVLKDRAGEPGAKYANDPEPAKAAPPAARRGRAPASAKQTAAPQPTPAPAVEPTKQYAATDDDLPQEIKATAHEQLSQEQRFANLTGKLSADHARKIEDIKVIRDAFLRAFTNHKGTLPKPPNVLYDNALPWLEALVARKPERLLADAHTLGIEVAGGRGRFVRFIDAWSDETKAIARKAALARCPQVGGADIIDFVEMIQPSDPLHPLPAPELRIALQVYGISGPAISALLNTAEERGVPYSQVLGTLDLTTATEKDILTACAGVPSAPVAAGAVAQSLWD